MGKRVPAEGQGDLFAPSPRPTARPQQEATERWKMPENDGFTVAEIRLRWSKRLTPGQVAKVEAELNRLPVLLSKLRFGAVEVERAFVRRRRQ